MHVSKRNLAFPAGVMCVLKQAMPFIFPTNHA